MTTNIHLAGLPYLAVECLLGGVVIKHIKSPHLAEIK
jgi:hypothetical protein